MEDLQYDFFMKTSEFLENAGYIHYEVSNFARGMRFASRHNQKYWDHTPYLGLAPQPIPFGIINAGGITGPWINTSPL